MLYIYKVRNIMEAPRPELSSHKGGKIKTYGLTFKLEAVRMAEDSGIRSTAERLGVDRKRIREWKKQKVGFQFANIYVAFFYTRINLWP